MSDFTQLNRSGPLLRAMYQAVATNTATGIAHLDIIMLDRIRWAFIQDIRNAYQAGWLDAADALRNVANDPVAVSEEEFRSRLHQLADTLDKVGHAPPTVPGFPGAEP